MSKQDEKYSKAIKRLEKILAQLESESVEIDDLPELVAEAASLIKQCKAKLARAELELKNVLEGIERSDKGKPDIEEEEEPDEEDDEDIDKTQEREQLDI